MTLREAIADVLAKYLTEKNKPFANNPLGEFVRHKIPEILNHKLSGQANLVAMGSVGQGNWANGPWVAIFDTLVTESAQSGQYPVYLFREDMRGVYLSLNQGVKLHRTLPQQLQGDLNLPGTTIRAYARAKMR